MIVVTGATGLVGSHLVKELAKHSHNNIVALYHNTAPTPQLQQLATWNQIDILDINALEGALQHAKRVYHCAALVSFNPRQKKLLHQLNIEGTKNVVNACINCGVEKLVHVSSVAALNRNRNGVPVTEKFGDATDKDNSEYGKTKMLSEMEVWRAIGEGLNAVIVNPTIILGSGNWHIGSTAIFKSAYNEFAWYTNGTNGFVDVADVVQAMMQLMNSNITNERFIVSGHNTSYKNLFATIAKHFNKKPPHKLVTPLLAQVVWRLEYIKSLLTKSNPLLTKETAASAQANVVFDNSKLLQSLPGFTYNSLEQSVQRICSELREQYSLDKII